MPVSGLRSLFRRLPLLFLVGLIFATQIPEARRASALARVPLFTVYEQTVRFSVASLANPWRDARLQVSLRRPSGRTVTISGFYYEPDAWQFRFAPDELGDWSWLARLIRLEGEDGGQLGQWEGGFTAIPSSEPGFLRVRTDGLPRLVYQNGALFPALGIGDCILDFDNSGSPNDNNWGFDQGEYSVDMRERFTSLATYAKAYGKSGAGFDFFRWSVGNCSFPLWDRIAPGQNRYLSREGRWGDEIVQTMRANGFRVMLVMFGFDPPFALSTRPADLAAVREYVEYVVARYAAWVDVWELMNESGAGEEWYQTVVGAIRASDPYQHPISTSWERPGDPLIDIVAPHWYDSEPEEESDARVAAQIDRFRKPRQPVVFGEQGNRGQNWDERSAIRLRHRAWSALFNGGSIIFWNTSHTKDYRAELGNVYIGTEERGYVRVLQNLANGLSADARPFPPAVVPSEDGALTRAYGINDGPSTYYYFVHIVDRNRSVRAALVVSAQADAIASWIDPSTGQVLGEIEIGPGKTEIVSPPFYLDLALVVKTGHLTTNAGKTVANVLLRQR